MVCITGKTIDPEKKNFGLLIGKLKNSKNKTGSFNAFHSLTETIILNS